MKRIALIVFFIFQANPVYAEMIKYDITGGINIGVTQGWANVSGYMYLDNSPVCPGCATGTEFGTWTRTIGQYELLVGDSHLVQGNAAEWAYYNNWDSRLTLNDLDLYSFHFGYDFDTTQLFPDTLSYYIAYSSSTSVPIASFVGNTPGSADSSRTLNFKVSSVPEPSSLVLYVIGLIGVVAVATFCRKDFMPYRLVGQ